MDVEEYIREIRVIFEELAEVNAWEENGVKMFDRWVVAAKVYDRIAYSKYYSILKERRRVLLEIYNLLTDEDFEKWQEEIYESWAGKFI